MISIQVPLKPSKYRRLRGFAFVYTNKGNFHIEGDYFTIKDHLMKINCCYFYNMTIYQTKKIFMRKRNPKSCSWSGMNGMTIIRSKRLKRFLYCVKFDTNPFYKEQNSPKVISEGIYWYRRMPHTWLPEWNKHIATEWNEHID